MKGKIFIAALLICLLLAACSRASNTVYDNTPAGFWDGLWHGLTAGFIFLWDTFFRVEDPTLYSPNNVGYWYNCGFFCIAPLIGLAVSSVFAFISRKIME